MKDQEYMKLALDLAKGGMGYVNPNPMVGAVIVKNGKIIGQGYHQVYGKEHAEVNAINSAIEDPKGSTIYVTLEPCSHYGSQPPCSKKLIEVGIKKVVIGSKDPNPLVAGRGIKELKDNGIEVVEGVLEDECLKLNEIFFHYIKNKKPFVAMKYAMSLDGKIATSTGDSKWISCEKSREDVHRLRLKYSSILVGLGTVLKDDPMLNCRLHGVNKNPIRIICDTNLRTPLDSKIAKSAREIKTFIATSEKNKNSFKPYIDLGFEGIFLNESKIGVDLKELFAYLGEIKIDSVLVEGGGIINDSLLKSGCLNKVYAYIAPILIGGKDAKTPLGGEGFKYLKDSLKVKNISIKQIDRDFLIEGDL
ncbi:bifunctional diaminohydroxyphosphoribosylaminopyrimidine deaminase/5-amino-6-(5-phosphoribosylamino)uracil reductase RibD [Peptoniphilus catoniae]|uniref:bifunctional diaminohydroxyphosphoribosylaminopyrimidine deaminase/5-amino-6-(5-phosphoribosylamino)uracil reductase RibD n=1 Tax=Peptoniphilus catoniae TaxID=1660341 RepID=UPI0010FF1EAF|nr:bifunctional diaminohydroxyphosphoribosylaminopyrimidine deaminase/5-amino-6-(5-phosphoribosylamino)uracil reductase RibD [Peptoniphilus catoniae]